MKKAILYAMCYAALTAEFIKKIINTVKLVVIVLKKDYKKIEIIPAKSKCNFYVNY